MAELGLEGFVYQRRVRGDFTSLAVVPDPARRLLHQYKHRCTPIVLAGGKCTEGYLQSALAQGLHQSALEGAPFLHK